MRAALRSIQALILVGLISVLAAQAAGAEVGRITEGTLLWRTAGQTELVPAPTLKTDVRIVVTGIVARASVRQEFTNPSRLWAEGIYVFPLPEDAAVDHLRMHVGDRVIEGVIQDRAAAKAQYEQAKQQGKRASLVEQERPNVFTTSVANIAPGAAISIEIDYQQTVRYDAGQFRLRFPMVVGPRYIPGAPTQGPSTGTGWADDTDAVPDASRITPPVAHPSLGAINPVALTVELDPGAPLARLSASYHAVSTTPLADGRYRVELAQGPVPADRDFELVWQPSAEATPIATLFTERKGAETFAILMVTPPAAAAVDRPRLPREVIFVIDNSGSMHGASIDQAKAALKLALERLRPDDTFNVIRFNHTTDSVFPGARAATQQNLAAAHRYVGRLRADGGTEMLPALQQALDGREHPGRLRQVIFLTDGAVGNEAQLFSAIHERLGDSRLFTIGIGSAPNSHFMREAARGGRGTFTYIGDISEVKEKMVALFAKLESPALTDVEIELAGAEIVPEKIPDLYLGEPISVALRAPAPPARVVLRGRLGVEVWEQVLALHPTGEEAGLSSHWARAKIAGLLDRRRTGSPEEEVRAAVLPLALAHHLISPYTSLVAVDVTPVRPENESLSSHALETNLPHGWDYTAVFGAGQGATSGPVHLAVGLVALLLAGALTVAIYRNGAPALAGRARRRL
ncbi:MAG TPA: marine proteobacterial sortase target protein [Methylomirabilota bacterium]|nr:marine proteobacterial sortase target protein [Methylomirabilota bacterium]